MIKIKRSELKKLAIDRFGNDSLDSQNQIAVMIAVAHAARVSYTVIGAKEKKPNYEADIQLHDFLLAQQHLSPFEHCAMVPDIPETGSFTIPKGITHMGVNGSNDFYSGNFKGWIQYRQLINNK